MLDKISVGDQQSRLFAGIVDMAAQLNESSRPCITAWYYNNGEAQRQIIAALGKYRQHQAVSVIHALIRKTLPGELTGVITSDSFPLFRPACLCQPSRDSCLKAVPRPQWPARTTPAARDRVGHAGGAVLRLIGFTGWQSRRLKRKETTMSEEKNAPVAKARLGRISTSTFRNTTDNGEYLNVQLQKAYRDKDGNWKHSSISFDMDQIPAAIRVLQEAMRQGFELQSESAYDE